MTKFWIEYQTLTKTQFKSLRHICTERIEFDNEIQRANFRKENFAAIAAMEKQLSKTWTIVDDFEFSSNFDYYYFLSGCIYSRNALCAGFVETMTRTLRRFNRGHTWSVMMYVEIEEDSPFDSLGEFLIRGDACYISEENVRKGFNILEILGANRQ